MAVPSIVIVGGGPRGTGVLERLAASAPELAPGGLEVHVVDPYPPGAGRIWRTEQSALLWMNSMAADVTMFTDDTVVCEGPIVPGPSLWEWAEALQSGSLDGETAPDGPEGDELRALGPATFPTRRLQSHYLDFVLRRVLAALPDGVEVHLHRTTAAAVTGTSPQRVQLSDGEVLRADVLVLASGHLDADLTDEERAFADFAADHDLRYFPPEQTTDSRLDVIPAGETVIARGMGLAFVDLVVLLFEGRGGRFVEVDDSGTLEYVPSGDEPVLHVGSGRGVPYHAKTEYSLIGPRPPLPRFLGPGEIAGFVARGEVDLRAQVWPLMAKEVGWGWYHELFHGHPDQVVGSWEDFAARYAEVEWYSPQREELVAETVPDEADRLDFERIDRPLAGVCTDAETLQKHLRAYVLDDLERHVNPRHTAELGAFVALLSTFMQVAELAGTTALTPRSRAQDLAWWQNLFSSLASGPPGPRLRQLLALSRAGYVMFMGAGFDVRTDAGRERFVATSASLDGTEVVASTFVEARLSAPSVSRSADPLLASLHDSGQLDEEVLTEDRPACSSATRSADAAAAHGAGAGVVLHNTGLVRVRTRDHHVLDAAGEPVPGRFAIGPHTNVRLPGAFTRPRTNALSFRANDALARGALRACVHFPSL